MSDSRRKRYAGTLKNRNENGSNGTRSQAGPQHNSRGRNNNSQGGYHGYTKMNGSDRVKKIVQEEGRTARNLVLYHVPVQSNAQYPNDRSRPRQIRKNTLKDAKDLNDSKSSSKSADLLKSPKTDGSKKPDLRARYWKFLFDNLQRAVDAIYETCEQDESALECREVIMMLTQSTRDFQSLIDRLHVQKEYELATKEGDRPTSIAWEVRKMSPGKSPSGLGHHGHTSPSPAQRVLNFSQPTESVNSASTQRAPVVGNSWADRVRGKPVHLTVGENTLPKESHPVLPEPPILSPVPSSQTESDSYKEANESEESDGWETVQRTKTKPWGSPSQRSLENLSTGSGHSTEHYKLKRSISDPNASVQKFKRSSHRVKGGRSPEKDVKHGSNQSIQSIVSEEEEILMGKTEGKLSGKKLKQSEKENNKLKQTLKSASSSPSVNSAAQVNGVSKTPSRGEKVYVNKSNNLASNAGSKRSLDKPTYSAKTAASAKSESSSKIAGTAKSESPKTTGSAKSESSSKIVGTAKSESPKTIGSAKSESSSKTIGSAKSESSLKTVGVAKGVKTNIGENTDKIKTPRSAGGIKKADLRAAAATSATSSGDINKKEVKTEIKVIVNGDPIGYKPDIAAEVKMKLEEIKLEESKLADEPSDSSKLDNDSDSTALDDALASVLDAEDSLTVELEKEQEQALKSAIQEEETWLKELAREENTAIEFETEDSDLGNTMSSLEASGPGVLDWDAMVAEYDAAEEAGESKDWGEMVEEAETRTPGHAVHMHEKLSSPSRKRSPTESKKRHEAKQAKAQELRDKLMLEKSERLKVLGKKVEEVRAWKEELMRQKREMIERKMQQAEEKRQIMLKTKAQKAHDEEAKANEIAFINTLEAQNKRHDIITKHQESEARLQDIQDERQRKHEEKLAKEAAVEERRRTLQAERLARLQEIQARRKIKDARVEQHKFEKETERQEACRAKEKDREERLAALNAQHELHIQELQKKIQQKQDESSQRHMEALRQIREKAFEMSVLRHSTEDHNDAPKLTPYESKKMCTVCNALITSEVYLQSHLRGKTHQQALKHNNNGMSMSKEQIESFNLKHIVTAPDNTTHPKIVSEKERIKSMKKRCKKLKQRMNSRGLEYDGTLTGKQPTLESPNKAKMQKVMRDLTKYLQIQDSGPWSQSRVSSLDRALGELNRIFDKKGLNDQVTFRHLGGLTTLSRIVQLVDTANIQSTPPIPQKSLVLVCQVFKQACKLNFENSHYMMFSNKISLLIELCTHQLMLMLPTDQISVEMTPGTDVIPKLPHNLLAINLMQLITTILACLAKNSPSTKSSDASQERMSKTLDAFTSRGNDVISYLISVGIVDKLTQYLRMVQGPIDEDRDAAEFIQHGLGLLISITKFMSKRKLLLFDKKKMEDPTSLISTFEVTELVGIVSLLYGMLLHSGTPSRGDLAPPEFPSHTLAVATTGLRMLNHMATLDLDMMQSTMGQEGMSLEFRHIASYLIWYCSHHNAEELLHEIILCVGYFTVQHSDNQVVIQSGQAPTVLQQLCSLPFQYFSDPRLVGILFPTLISCCYNNKGNQEILEQELSCTLLSNFIEEKQLELIAQSTSVTPAKKGSEKEKEGDTRMVLASRFPAEQWTAAQEYFSLA